MPWNLEMQQRWKHWAELSHWAAVLRCLHLSVREAERGVSKFFPSVKYVHCQFSLPKVGQGSPRRPMDSRYSVWMLVKDEWLGKGKWPVTRKRQEMDSKWNTRYQCEVNPTRIKANQQNWALTALLTQGKNALSALFRALGWKWSPTRKGRRARGAAFVKVCMPVTQMGNKQKTGKLKSHVIATVEMWARREELPQMEPSCVTWWLLWRAADGAPRSWAAQPEHWVQ